MISNISLQNQIASLKRQIAILQKMICCSGEIPENTVLVPSPPSEGNYTLISVDGELSWNENI